MNRYDQLALLFYPFMLYLLFASITPVTCPTVLSNEKSMNINMRNTLIYKYELIYCNVIKESIYSYESPVGGMPYILQEWIKNNPTMTFHQTIFGIMYIGNSYFMRIVTMIFIMIAGSAHCCAITNVVDSNLHIREKPE